MSQRRKGNRQKRKIIKNFFQPARGVPLTPFLFVGHLGLEIRLEETHRLRCLLSAQPVQTNITEEITVGESPTQKKENRVSDSLVGHLGLEPRTSRL